MVRQILKLKNFTTAARIRLPVNNVSLQSQRSLSLNTSSSIFKLANKDSPVQTEQSQSTGTYERPTVYSDGEVETAGPVVRL